MPLTIETYIVDSFTDTPFKGNPAGVCLLDEELQDATMLSIAKELGLSETAFVMNAPDANHYTIRYFSPKMEIPLCGHATLASAKVIFENITSIDNINFITIEGIRLIAQKQGNKIEMEFPIYETIPRNAPQSLLTALGIESIINSAYNAETNILLLEIADCQVLRSMNPDYASLVASHDSINGVLVTARSQEDKYDFESRYFWPWSGTNEDPVTGGTHTFLAPYWRNILNKKQLSSFQCSERSGFMDLEVRDNGKLAIISQAQIILKGQFYI